MSKTVTLYLSTSPYSYENTLTSARIAESALNKGHNKEAWKKIVQRPCNRA